MLQKELIDNVSMQMKNWNPKLRLSTLYTFSTAKRLRYIERIWNLI